ncbi:30S ribosomal protein [Actinidia chinensis var. chinensis]|uniref:30S ribosomal protein n=1 Tax=Actinidia chinensis var. chinensis TaxID=1590841 RepID=A0A2R6QHP3_ACTCC|nr:30S ribosomal protein [Actinidia chinensis var. chinensis]
MGKGKNNHREGGHSSTSKLVEDPILAMALARPLKSSRDGEANAASPISAEATVAVEVDTETSKDLSVSPTQVSERDKQNEYLYSSLGVRQNAVVKTGNAQCESSIVGEDRVMRKVTQRAMQKTYVSLFAGNRHPSNGSKLDFYNQDEGPIKLGEEDILGSNCPWERCLLGYFGGRFLGKQALSQLVALWKVHPSIQFHGSGWIIFQFSSMEDLSKVLENGQPNASGELRNKLQQACKMQNGSLAVGGLKKGIVQTTRRQAFTNTTAKAPYKTSTSNPNPSLAKGEEVRKKKDKEAQGKSGKSTSLAEFCADMGGIYHGDYGNKDQPTNIRGDCKEQIQRPAGSKQFQPSPKWSDHDNLEGRLGAARHSRDDKLGHSLPSHEDPFGTACAVPALRTKALKLAEAEISYCTQLAKAKFLRNSDKGTKIFHNMIKSRRAKSSISSITLDDGRRSTLNKQVNGAFVQYYIGLLGFKGDCTRLSRDIVCKGKSLDPDQATTLTHLVIEEEIKYAPLQHWRG